MSIRGKHRTAWWPLASMFVALLLASCAGGTAPTRSAPQLSTATVPASAEPYVIQAGDDLEVKFQLTPELNERQVVRPDGMITMQLIDHEIAAAGMTVEQLRRALLSEYDNQLKDPKIAVLVREFSQYRVFVGGEVGLVGPQPLNRATTVRQAIIQAQGFKDTAEPSQVILYRQPPGKPASYQVLNLSEYPSNVSGDQDVWLAPLDIVYVPRSGIADMGRFVELYVRRLLPIQPSLQIPIP
jgi:protein involved in polysaccharide export with SLBB domain